MDVMKIHLSERDPQHHAWPKRGVDKEHMQLKILLSYWYYKDIDLDVLFAKYFTEPYPEVFADSGAFSAMTQGSPVDIDEYATWVKRWRHLFTVYANLDVIKDAEATWQNQQYLEDKHGLTPLPAYHVLEEWSWLEHYVERYPYIALGVAGMQQRKDEMIRWLVKCFQIAKGRSVFHGFALTSWQVMSSFPWYSVDSSSWGQGFRFGQVPLFDFKKGRFQKASLGDTRGCAKHASLFREYGFEWQDFADRSRNDRAKICAISALSYMRAEQWLRRFFGEIYIPNRPDAPVGLRAHLVTAASSDTAPKGSNMSVNALGTTFGGIYEVDTAKALAHTRDAHTGVRLHLADTSNGINYGDADKGLKIYGCAKGQNEGNQMSPGSLAAGLRQGVKLHLADAGGNGGKDLETLGNVHNYQAL